MGINYLTKNIKNYYKQQFKPYLIKEGGQKQAMPRYFRDQIFNESERKKLGMQSKLFIEENKQFKNHHDEHEWKKNQFRQRDKKVRAERKQL